MNSRGGVFNVLFILILLVALAIASYYLYQYWPREPVPLDRIPINPVEANVTNTVPSKQFYPRMRYADRIVPYTISSSCSPERANAIGVAMDNLERNTRLEFNPVSPHVAQLHILCSDVTPEAGQENYFVAGEGGPTRVLNSTLYSVILEGKVALYREDTCPGANVATHELLHALGFDHNNNRNSILYPTLNCDQTIDPEIIESINKLYAADSLPDLIIETVEATKSGSYLNFHIEILNQGLLTSGPVTLGVYTHDTLVEHFEVGAISVGSKKLLDVENLRIPSGTTTVTFSADDPRQVTELDEQNNEAILRLVPQ